MERGSVSRYHRTQLIQLPLGCWWKVWGDDRRTWVRAVGWCWTRKQADRAIDEVFRKEANGEYE